MREIEIFSIIVGYMYLFISIFIGVVKLAFIFLKKQILPNALVYYLLKILSGTAGLAYGLTFLDKISYYLVTPFLAVLSLDFIILGVVSVLNLKQYFNRLQQIHPQLIENSKSNNFNTPKRRKLRNKKLKRSKSDNNLQEHNKSQLRSIKSTGDIKKMEQDYMTTYISSILAEYNYSNRYITNSSIQLIENNSRTTSPIKPQQKNKIAKKPKRGKKGKKKKKDKNKKTKDFIEDETEEIGEEIFEEVEEDESEDEEDESDDEEEESDEEEDESDDEEDESEDDDDDEDDEDGIMDYVGDYIEGILDG